MLPHMNFFSHAAVASWYDATPGFVLGAMLPDFYAMLGLRSPKSRESLVARGISFHHQSDAAFHNAPAFVRMTHDGRRMLEEAGLAKGPARATAHIGVELLLDPLLGSDPRVREAYVSALASATDHVDALEFAQEFDRARLLRLAALLAERGGPSAVFGPDELGARIQRALQGRPRLAIDDAGRALVRDWVVAMRPRVVGCALLVVTELISALEAAGCGSVARHFELGVTSES